MRNWLYDVGLLKSAKSPIPTVGIGNLRMGGTGKTPHTEYLIRLFSDRRTALLSRGYGRHTKGFLLAEKDSTAHDIGDEPAMIARKFPDLTVAVCEDRLEGCRRLAQLPTAPQLILLDDVYQHRGIRPDLLILLTEYSDLYCDDHILPFGNLREFRRGSRRADIVVVTKCPPFLSDKKQDKYRQLLKLSPNQQLFFSHISYLPPVPLFGNAEWHPVKKVLLVTGIAHPDPLKHHLEKQCTVTHLAFPDHHTFSSADCGRIRERFLAIKDESKAIITTEKDAIRLLANTCLGESDISGLIYYIPISIAFSNDSHFCESVVISAAGNAE